MESRSQSSDGSFNPGNIDHDISSDKAINTKINKISEIKHKTNANSSKVSFFGTNSITKTYLRRLHIGTNRSHFSQKVLNYLAKLQKENKYLTEGFKLSIENAIAIIIKCDPVGGYLSEDTIIYVEDSIKPLERVYFLWDVKDYNFLRDCVSLFVENTKGITADLISSRVYYGPFRINKINNNNSMLRNHSLKLILKEKNYSDNENQDKYYDDPDNSGRFSGTTCASDLPFDATSETEVPDECDFYLFHQDNSGNLILTDPNDKIYYFFDRMFQRYLKNLLEIPRFYFFGNNQLIGDLTFFVSSLEPTNKPGYIDYNTEIYFGFDPFENFDQVTVSPLKDTLPVNYRYNLLEDCVKPFFRLNSFKIFRLGDVFNFSGIQFRITNLSKSTPNVDNYFNFSKILTCPKYGRINSNTEINLGKPVKPKLMDLLPFERIEILRRSAPCYRENLLICFASDLDVNSLDRIYQTNSTSSSPINSLNNSLNNSTNSSINTSSGHSLNNSLNGSSSSSTSFKQNRRGSLDKDHMGLSELNSNIDTVGTNSMCTVCCDAIDLRRTGNLIFLNCGHVFHKRCVSTWISTKKSCPNCRTKLTLDRDFLTSSRLTSTSSTPHSILNNITGFSLSPTSISNSNFTPHTYYGSEFSDSSINSSSSQHHNSFTTTSTSSYTMFIANNRNSIGSELNENSCVNDIFYQYDTFERDSGRQRSLNHPFNILDNSIYHFNLDNIHIENIIGEESSEEESESDLEVYFNALST